MNALTGIRFFAAVDIVLLHTKLPTALSKTGWHALGNFFLNGSLSVALFFILSGFILSYTYHGQLRKPSGSRRFWEARFARVWPVYTASLLFTSLMTWSLPAPQWIVASMLMVQAWTPFDPAMWGVWNFVCWTISTEAFFYLCFPWIELALEKLSPRMLLVVCGAMLALIVSLNLSILVLGYGSPTPWMNVTPRPVVLLPEFIVGMTLGGYFLRCRAALEEIAARPPLFFHGGLTYVSLVAMVALMCRDSDRWTSAVTVSFATLIFGLAAEETWFSRFLSTRLLILGGSISYSVYLMQVPVKDLVKLLSSTLHTQSEAFTIPAMLVLLFGISYCSYKLIEVPARDKLRSLFAGLEARRAQRQG